MRGNGGLERQAIGVVDFNEHRAVVGSFDQPELGWEKRRGTRIQTSSDGCPGGERSVEGREKGAKGIRGPPGVLGRALRSCKFCLFARLNSRLNSSLLTPFQEPSFTIFFPRSPLDQF
jgi:hypothetical protein